MLNLSSANLLLSFVISSAWLCYFCFFKMSLIFFCLHFFHPQSSLILSPPSSSLPVLNFILVLKFVCVYVSFRLHVHRTGSALTRKIKNADCRLSWFHSVPFGPINLTHLFLFFSQFDSPSSAFDCLCNGGGCPCFFPSVLMIQRIRLGINEKCPLLNYFSSPLSSSRLVNKQKTTNFRCLQHFSVLVPCFRPWSTWSGLIGFSGSLDRRSFGRLSVHTFCRSGNFRWFFSSFPFAFWYSFSLCALAVLQSNLVWTVIWSTRTHRFFIFFFISQCGPRVCIRRQTTSSLSLLSVFFLYLGQTNCPCSSITVEPFFLLRIFFWSFLRLIS